MSCNGSKLPNWLSAILVALVGAFVCTAFVALLILPVQLAEETGNGIYYALWGIPFGAALALYLFSKL